MPAGSRRPTLLIELRWVTLTVPAGAALVPDPASTWSTRRPSDAVTSLGPPLRVLSGESAGWRLRSERPWGWVGVAVRGAGVDVPVPLAAEAGVGELRVVTHWQGDAQPVTLRLQWTPAEGAERAASALDTVLQVPVSRWVAVLREAEPAPQPQPPPGPGEWRSATAAPHRSRELQVRVRVVPEAGGP